VETLDTAATAFIEGTMDENKKDGVSVKEIEEFAKKHRFEVFFCLMFLLACVFGIFGTFRAGWNILFGMAGGVLGILLPVKMEQLLKKMFHFVFKQDTTILIVFGVVALVLTCVLPLLVFLLIGIAGGRAIHQMASAP
jgi:hypothetical protein